MPDQPFNLVPRVREVVEVACRNLAGIYAFPDNIVELCEEAVEDQIPSMTWYTRDDQFARTIEHTMQEHGERLRPYA